MTKVTVPALVRPVRGRYSLTTAPRNRVSGGTRDDGRTWTKLAVDDDGISPIEAKVPHDALWGLKIVIAGPAGMDYSPKPTDKPDMYVEVDTAVPHVELTAPEVHAGQILLRWTAKDSNIALAPIHVLYTTSPDGEWTVIAEGHENTGEYLWNVARAGLTGPVYVRIEAEDKAGNVGFAETGKILLTPPRARVIGVRPKATYRK